MEKYLLIGLIFLATILWFWAIIDIIKSKFRKMQDNIIWIFIVLIFPILGPIVYFQFKKYFKNKTIN